MCFLKLCSPQYKVFHNSVYGLNDKNRNPSFNYESHKSHLETFLKKKNSMHWESFVISYLSIRLWCFHGILMNMCVHFSCKLKCQPIDGRKYVILRKWKQWIQYSSCVFSWSVYSIQHVIHVNIISELHQNYKIKKITEEPALEKCNDGGSCQTCFISEWYVVIVMAVIPCLSLLSKMIVP